MEPPAKMHPETSNSKVCSTLTLAPSERIYIWEVVKQLAAEMELSISFSFRKQPGWRERSS